MIFEVKNEALEQSF